MKLLQLVHIALLCWPGDSHPFLGAGLWNHVEVDLPISRNDHLNLGAKKKADEERLLT